MKKIVLIALLVFSALLFVGCDVGQASINKSDDKKNTDASVVDNTEEDTNKENDNSDITENIDINDDEIKRIETLFTLEEAYKKKYISKNDLLNLHDNIENRVKFELDEDIKQKILNDYLINVRKYFADATIDDVSIYGYYGHYNNLYVVRLDNIFVLYPAVMKKLNIDGVVFSYSGPVYMVWLEENNILTTPIDGTYYGKLCYTYPGLSSISVDMVFEISNTKLIIHDDKELKIEECEYDDHFFDNLVLAKSYSLDYRQMFEYPNKGWFALLDSSETKKGGFSILISKFNTIYVFKTVFDLEKSTCHILAGYELTKLSNYTSDSVNSIIGEIDSYDVAWTTWNTMGTMRDIKIDYLKNIDDFQALLREKCIEDNSPVENRKEAYLNFAKEDGSTYGCHIVAILDYNGEFYLRIFTNQSSKNYTIESRELSNKIGDLIFGLSGISKTPTYNFKNDLVLVVVKKEYSGINKEWSLDFFGNLPIKEVKDLTYSNNPENIANQNDFRQILAIYLKEPSYQGVLDLIQELKKFDEFEYVEPNKILEVDCN